MLLTPDVDFAEGRVLLLDKPLYWTSFDLVSKVKNIIRFAYGIKRIRVGHAGTLDPLATGLMIVCTGKATKKIPVFQNLDKEYVARLKLGATRPSFDCETEIDKTYDTKHLTDALIYNVVKSFEGQSMQIPPVFSAVNIKGKRAYELARKGKEVQLQAKAININTIDIISCTIPDLVIKVKCSKGTYIRALARDIGEKLACGAYLVTLQRTAIGSFFIDKAINISELEEFCKIFGTKASM